MKEVKAHWIGNSKFVGTGSGGHSVVMDPDGETGIKPSELLLVGLAGCTGADVASILKKQRQRLTSLEIRVKGEQLPDPPWTFREIHLEYILRGFGLKESAVTRAIELSETKYCSVGSTIGGRARIVSSFQILEEERVTS